MMNPLMMMMLPMMMGQKISPDMLGSMMSGGGLGAGNPQKAGSGIGAGNNPLFGMMANMMGGGFNNNAQNGGKYADGQEMNNSMMFNMLSQMMSGGANVQNAGQQNGQAAQASGAQAQQSGGQQPPYNTAKSSYNGNEKNKFSYGFDPISSFAGNPVVMLLREFMKK